MANPIYNSVFDIHSAFYHIPIKPEHRHYTAFKTPTNCYEFVTMSQGLKNAPATLAHIMQAIFKGISYKYMQNFFDDILIYSPDFDSHIAHMREIFTRIRKSGFKLNLAKSQMCCKKIRFLGLNINADSIEATDDHIKTVQNFKTPNSMPQLRRFLGLTSWMRKFIPNYSYIAHSLYQLLKKNVKWIWTDEQQKAFDSLKTTLVSPPILSYPCWEEPYNLYTDASSFHTALF